MIVPNSELYLTATTNNFQGKYIKENDLGGASLWTLDLDDYLDMCGCGAYPLLTVINKELFLSHLNPNKTFDCAL